MSKPRQTLTQAFLERISRGAVPMGGFYWVDPKELRGSSETVKPAEKAMATGVFDDVSNGRDLKVREVTAPNATTHAYAAPAGERS